MSITPQLLAFVRQVLSVHPDWGDEDVAEEVLSLEDD